MNEKEILQGYLSMRQICDEYPEFNWWRITYLMRRRDSNGWGKILVKVGMKFYVKRDQFEKWRAENAI